MFVYNKSQNIIDYIEHEPNTTLFQDKMKRQPQKAQIPKMQSIATNLSETLPIQ